MQAYFRGTNLLALVSPGSTDGPLSAILYSRHLCSWSCQGLPSSPSINPRSQYLTWKSQLHGVFLANVSLSFWWRTMPGLPFEVPLIWKACMRYVFCSSPSEVRTPQCACLCSSVSHIWLTLWMSWRDSCMVRGTVTAPVCNKEEERAVQATRCCSHGRTCWPPTLLRACALLTLHRSCTQHILSPRPPGLSVPPTHKLLS